MVSTDSPRIADHARVVNVYGLVGNISRIFISNWAWPPWADLAIDFFQMVFWSFFGSVGFGWWGSQGRDFGQIKEICYRLERRI